MDTSYWNKVLDRRVSRRRTLAATGATALGAAFLAACGGDDNESGGGGGGGGGKDTSGLLAKREDTTQAGEARRHPDHGQPGRPASLRPAPADAAGRAATSLIFTKLIQVKPGIARDQRRHHARRHGRVVGVLAGQAHADDEDPCRRRHTARTRRRSTAASSTLRTSSILGTASPRPAAAVSTW